MSYIMIHDYAAHATNILLYYTLYAITLYATLYVTILLYHYTTVPIPCVCTTVLVATVVQYCTTTYSTYYGER
jgi:hypothetical protein